MEDCELVELKPTVRKDENIFEEYIDAGYGPVLVAQQGAKIKPKSSQCCIITFHDLGLNYALNFQTFFNHPLMKPILNHMPVFHINAPGQEDDAEKLSDDYVFPTMSQLAESVITVCNYYGIKQAICFGVGVGANVMSRVAHENPDLIDGIFLINPVPTAAGWMEWAYHKRNMYYLNSLDSGLSLLNKTERSSSFPQCLIDYLIWHHFGYQTELRCPDLINMYKSYFSSYRIQPRNLAHFIGSYLSRDDIGVYRGADGEIKCPTLILCGNDSPYLDDSINMNQRLNPERSTWMKLFDCGLALDEQPRKVAEAFILFVQGLGLGLLTCYRFK